MASYMQRSHAYHVARQPYDEGEACPDIWSLEKADVPAAGWEETNVAASRITSATAWGCEVMIAWEPLSSVILAPAR